MVTHYLQCLANLQTVATHVAQKLPALLKLFHTKAYQQVASNSPPRSLALTHASSVHAVGYAPIFGGRLPVGRC